MFRISAAVLLLLSAVAAELIVCPESGHLFYAHPSSCSQFLECNDGQYSIVDCIEGLHYDPTLGFCNFPDQVGCVLEEVEGNKESENEERLIECPESGQLFFAHPSSCSQFIECNEGEYRVVACIEGLHFNTNLGFCDFPQNVGCELEADNGNITEGDEDVTDGAEGNGDIDGGDIDDGQENGETDGGGGNNNGQDDGVGENGNEGDGTEGAVDEEEGDGYCPAAGQHFYPHPTICSQFIECNEGEYNIVECIAGLYFNPSLGWCDFPENVDCMDTTLIPSTTTNAPTTTTEAPTTPTTTTTATQGTTIDDPNAEGGPVGECPQQNGPFVDFLTDSKDCTIFYKCNWGIPVQMSCPPSLHFNPTLNVCDWPVSSGCTVGK